MSRYATADFYLQFQFVRLRLRLKSALVRAGSMPIPVRRLVPRRGSSQSPT